MNKRDLKKFEDINKLMEKKESEVGFSFLDRLFLIDLQIRDDQK